MKSAEDWLAQRGVERRPIVVRLDDPPAPEDLPDPGSSGPAPSVPADPGPGEPPVLGGGQGAGGRLDAGPLVDLDDEEPVGDLSESDQAALARAAAPLVPQPDPMTPPRVVETVRVAQAADLERRRLADLEAAEHRERPSLGDDVAVAMAYIRQATSATPMSTGRLRTRLLDRDTPEPVIDLALQRAAKEGLVDDDAFAAALVREWRAKGHAGARIRMDLRARGFDNDLIHRVLDQLGEGDPEAAAFAIARDRAPSLSGLEPEKAFRRLVGHLARRGHPEALARKVARQVLWSDREQERTAGH